MFTKADIQHLITKVQDGRIVLVADHTLGLPTIHGIRGAEHIGFGCFIASNPDFKVSFDGGGAMYHTSPSRISYTFVHVDRGTFPYDRDEVLNTLNTLLENASD